MRTRQAENAEQIPALEIVGLTRRFSRVARPAVANVSFALKAGEILAFLGASGSGKTTLLRLIAGFETPDDGSIRLAGVQVAGMRTAVPPEHRRVGLVFQETSLFPHMTIMQNVAFGLRNLGAAGRSSRARELLSTVGLQGLEDRYPHQISGGQAQRVALARALGPQPSVLLLDEPFNNLDVLLKRPLTDELSRILRRTGTTTILVTHDLDEAFSLADRIAVLRDGSLQQIDVPRRLYAHPANAYVAGFLGRTNLVGARQGDEGCLTDLGLVVGASPIRHDGRLVISVRPHDLRLAKGWQDEPCGIHGKVARVRFHGEYLEVLVTPAREPEKVIVVHTGVNHEIRQGEQVTVTLHGHPAPLSTRLAAG